jgi:predicted nucleic acid-binding protein
MPVIDSSVAIKWVIEENDQDAALDLLERASIVAPDFLPTEVRAALWGKVRRRLHSVEEMRRAEAEFSRIAVPLISSNDIVREAFTLALELSHPIYDCLYLAAAIRLNEPLVTADRRFVAALANTKYADRAFALTQFPLD